MTYKIEKISPELAEKLCRQITADLPEYFGLPDCNEHYAKGVHSRINFAAKTTTNYVGLLSLEFPYQTNGNIYWMGVIRESQGQGVGHLLIEEASNYAKCQSAMTLTVETLAPAESDENYLKTYRFYENTGFYPLFNLKPEGYEWNMVYMAKNLIFKQHATTNPLITIKQFDANDIDMIVNNFAKHNWPKPKATFENYLLEQKNKERMIWLGFYEHAFAGYITLKWHSFYPPFKEKNIPEIMDLNVLPPYQKKGIGTCMLDIAEKEALINHDIVGLGVGLYEGYGSAQKIYIARNYRPDGLGITYNYKHIEPGSMVCLDDDLVLWFTKQLK